MRKIVLTRPRLQAQSLAQKLTGLGYSVELFPLLEITCLPEQSELQLNFQATIRHLKRYALAVFVSPNAIRAVFNNGLVWPPGVAIAVMGEGSRAVLAQYGIDEQKTRVYCPTNPSHSDSEALLQELDLPALKGCEVVIFRAETGRELLTDELVAKDILVTKVASYCRFAPPVTPQSNQTLHELLASPNNWVVNSSEALRTLVDMIDNVCETNAIPLKKTQSMEHIYLWVSHRRIAEAAEKCGFKSIRLTGSGDENLLLALQSESVNLA